MVTKIEKILERKGLSQADLMRLIEKKTGFRLGRDRISKICTGRLQNYTIESALMIAEALGVKVDQIIEKKKIRKKNAVTFPPLKRKTPVREKKLKTPKGLK